MAAPIPSTATTPFPAFPKPRSHPFLLPARASSDPGPDPGPVQTASDEDNDFESRLSRVRGRNRVGSGKKARKSSASTSSEAAGIYLPPVALKEPKSGGLKVEFGFSPYSERVNGRMAMLGLTALLLVELAAGKGIINYHTPGVILTQIYFVVGVSALFVKYEKERVSVWPNDRSSMD